MTIMIIEENKNINMIQNQIDNIMVTTKHQNIEIIMVMKNINIIKTVMLVTDI